MKNHGKISKIALLAAASAALITAGTPVSAGTDAYLGEIMLNGYTFCPRATASAEGQLLAINANQALYSLYGTTYGGDGRTTFALPDLRGRAPIGQGTGPGLSSQSLGQKGGNEFTTLTLTQMPAHSHAGSQVRSENAVVADTGNPGGNAFARSNSQVYSNNSPPTEAGAMHAGSLFITTEGGGQPFSNMSPYLVMRYCVYTQGIFPSRS